ncbi:MAG: hypothetical protein EOP06_27800 [Proteobacteria bacterium]|nr:MAG: hypothetical protein EOP06_27800 [Pseudomonadota bacterium]
MTNYIGKFDGYTLRVFNGTSVIGSIDFNRDGTPNADIYVLKKRYHVGPTSTTDKNIRVTSANTELFTFKFDALWGGAELETNGQETGFEVKGKWFKPGTRLVDAQSNDLVAIKNGDVALELDIAVSAEDIPEVMLLATVYYHVYSSRSKLLLTMFSYAEK